MAENSTTELEAVNTLLHSIGEASVNSLTNLPIDGTQAKNILTEVSREVQATGWHFNKFFDFDLSRDNNNKIPLADNIMRVDLDTTKYPRSTHDVIKRGAFLYNKVGNTFVFTDTLKALVTLFLPFNELPENARRYIVLRASRMFQDRTLGAGTLHNFHMQDEMQALARLKQEEMDTADHSIFDSPDIAMTITRGHKIV